MRAVENDERFDLIDPHTKLVKKSIKARQIWEEILTVRSKTGEPYLNFIDTINNSMNEELKEKGLKIVSLGTRPRAPSASQLILIRAAWG